MIDEHGRAYLSYFELAAIQCVPPDSVVKLLGTKWIDAHVAARVTDLEPQEFQRRLALVKAAKVFQSKAKPSYRDIFQAGILSIEMRIMPWVSAKTAMTGAVVTGLGSAT